MNIEHQYQGAQQNQNVQQNQDAQPKQHTQDWLIQNFQQWIKNRHEDVVEATRIEGGWEVWAQIELYLAMKRTLGEGKGALKREETGIWQHSPNDRVDFWFDWGKAPNPNNDSYVHWGIELKCRTAAESHAQFLGRVLGDFDKCNKTPVARPTVLYVVGISDDQNDYTGYGGNWAFLGPTWYSIISDPAKRWKDIYLVWRQFEHLESITTSHGISFNQFHHVKE